MQVSGEARANVNKTDAEARPDAPSTSTSPRTRSAATLQGPDDTLTRTETHARATKDNERGGPVTSVLRLPGHPLSDYTLLWRPDARLVRMQGASRLSPLTTQRRHDLASSGHAALAQLVDLALLDALAREESGAAGHASRQHLGARGSTLPWPPQSARGHALMLISSSRALVARASSLARGRPRALQKHRGTVMAHVQTRRDPR